MKEGKKTKKKTNATVSLAYIASWQAGYFNEVFEGQHLLVAGLPWHLPKNQTCCQREHSGLPSPPWSWATYGRKKERTCNCIRLALNSGIQTVSCKLQADCTRLLQNTFYPLQVTYVPTSDEACCWTLAPWAFSLCSLHPSAGSLPLLVRSSNLQSEKTSSSLSHQDFLCNLTKAQW